MALSINIDVRHPTPLYHQLERAILFAITTGKIALGDQLPTVRQLAVDLRINANTVAKVYAELERSGVVETRRGVGTFVRAPHPDGAVKANHERELSELEDRFLGEAAGIGFSAKAAVDHLRERVKRMK